MRRVAVGAVHIAIAAGLLRAGVASACYPPAECNDDSSLEVPAAPLQITGADCQHMVLFTLDDVTANLAPSTGGSTEESSASSLTDVRIASVVPLDTKQSGARFGSAAFCIWDGEYGEKHKYAVTVQARDGAGKLRRGVASVVVSCGSPPQGFSSVDQSRLVPIKDSEGQQICDPRCVAEVPEPPPDCTQCQCNADGGGSGGGDSDGGSSSGEGSNTDMLMSASPKQTAGSCAAFPGAGSAGALVLAMLGAGLVLRRRR